MRIQSAFFKRRFSISAFLFSDAVVLINFQPFPSLILAILLIQNFFIYYFCTLRFVYLILYSNVGDYLWGECYHKYLAISIIRRAHGNKISFGILPSSSLRLLYFYWDFISPLAILVSPLCFNCSPISCWVTTVRVKKNTHIFHSFVFMLQPCYFQYFTAR